MIRVARVIFCDNEHGTGDVCFPDVAYQGAPDITDNFINTRTAKQLRREAKKAGWRVIYGADYCPSCVECIAETSQEAQ
jgi:hypothetical protein